MAAKGQGDSVVNERRLRPIYDCIDNGNNKKAIQEAEKVLKKQPNLHCAKALKALALRRLSRYEESEALLVELLNEEPDDDATLQAMAISFREFQRPDWTCQAYENAVKKDRNNEEFLSHLFMSYVRTGEYKKQQQIAMALYKVRPKNPYYFWAVMSVVMQAYNADKSLSRQIVLPLAERLITKAVEENRLEAEAEVQLYLLVLDLQEKYDKALEVLDGPLGQKLYPLVACERKGEWLMKLERWEAAAAHFKNLIADNRDQWSYYSNFVKSILQCPEARHQEAVEFLQSMKLAELANEVEKKRGPFLAQFLWHEKHQAWLHAQHTSNGRSHDAEEVALMNLFVQYVDIFGSKPCCFADLKQFLLLLGPEQQQHLLKKIQTDTHDTVKELQRHLLYLQIRNFLGLETGSDSKQLADIVEYTRQTFKDTREVGGPFLPTDIRPGDWYAILGCQQLLNSDKSVANLPDVIHWLEDVRQTSPSNHYVKMFLVKTYVLAGLGQQAASLYDSLDVKYIQQDSMSHLLLYPALFALGQWHNASYYANNTLKFFTTNIREISEYVIAAYKYGSFAKVLEFIKFREKLEKSFVLAAVTVEEMMLHIVEAKDYSQLSQVVQSMAVDFKKDEPCWEELVDNRDWKLMAVCENQSREVSQSLFESNFHDELRYARLRNRLLHLITRVVSSAAHYPPSSSLSQTNGTTDMQSNVNQLLQEIQRLCEEPVGPRPQYPFAGPLPSRLYAYLGAECPVVITSVVKALLQLLDLSDDSMQRPPLTPLFERLVTYADYRSNGLTCRYEMLERLTNASETVILSVLLLRVAFNSSQKNKKAKKKKETPSIAEGLNGFVEAIQPSCQGLIKLLLMFEEWTCPSRNLATIEQELPNLEQLSLEDIQTQKSSSTSELLAAVHEKSLLLQSCAS